MAESLWERMASAWLDAEGKDIAVPLSSARWRLVWRRALAAPLGGRDFDRLKWDDFIDEVRGPWRSMSNPAWAPVLVAAPLDIRSVAVRLGVAPRVALRARREVEAVYGASTVIVACDGSAPLPDPLFASWKGSSRLRWTDMHGGLPSATAEGVLEDEDAVAKAFPQARPGDMVRVEAEYSSEVGPLWVPLPEVWAVPAPKERGRRPRHEAPGLKEADRAMLIDVLKEALTDHGFPASKIDAVTLSALRAWARRRSGKPR